MKSREMSMQIRQKKKREAHGEDKRNIYRRVIKQKKRERGMGRKGK